ncbi:hypothetical protein RIF29_40791 [Crotalaria pallida]|uniref:Phytocyanin domain-containing protein n=1 Tax=Crotalaria pallida TaxID=3830 RepID=A0AAN9E654_CROPI
MGGGLGFQIKGMIVAVAVVLICGQWVEAQVHHVVGADRGWDPTSDLVYWSEGKVFRVGDQIWFAYSMAQGLIAELKSREEYESCDVSNPIKMYTEGLHTIPLKREGVRYFVSSEPENCKNGLKLHFEILPKAASVTSSTPTLDAAAAAAAPTAPSGTPSCCSRNTILIFILMFCVTVGLAY